MQNGAIRGLQIGARGITNRDSLRDLRSGQKGYKSRQDCEIGAKGFQIKAEITNRGKRDYKPGQGFQIGAEQLPLYCFEWLLKWKWSKYNPIIYLIFNTYILIKNPLNLQIHNRQRKGKITKLEDKISSYSFKQYMYISSVPNFFLFSVCYLDSKALIKSSLETFKTSVWI